MRLESEKNTDLAVELLRHHGPLAMADLLALMPRLWHDHLTDFPGRWLGAHLRADGRARRDPATAAWSVS